MTTVSRKFVSIRCIILIFGSLMYCLLASGCATSPEPRVVAERVFPADQLEAVVTTFPGDPSELTIMSCKVVEDSDIPVEMQRVEIEGRPGWRLRCDAPANTNKLTLRLVVQQAQRRFAVTIPFRRRNTHIAGQGRNVISWTTRRERIRDLGPADIFLTRNP